MNIPSKLYTEFNDYVDIFRRFLQICWFCYHLIRTCFRRPYVGLEERRKRVYDAGFVNDCTHIHNTDVLLAMGRKILNAYSVIFYNYRGMRGAWYWPPSRLCCSASRRCEPRRDGSNPYSISTKKFPLFLSQSK